MPLVLARSSNPVTTLLGNDGVILALVQDLEFKNQVVIDFIGGLEAVLARLIWKVKICIAQWAMILIICPRDAIVYRVAVGDRETRPGRYKGGIYRASVDHCVTAHQLPDFALLMIADTAVLAFLPVCLK